MWQTHISICSIFRALQDAVAKTSICHTFKNPFDIPTNRFDSLAETINDLSYQLSCHDVENLDNVSTVSSQPPKQEPSTQLSSKHPLSVKSIASMTADIILKEKEKETKSDCT